MAIQHNYKIKKIIKKVSQDNLKDIVYQIFCELKTIDTENPIIYDTVSEKQIEFDINNINEENFVPYENLTKELILSWIPEICNKWQFLHEKSIEEVKNPPIPEFVETEDFPFEQ